MKGAYFSASKRKHIPIAEMATSHIGHALRKLKAESANARLCAEDRTAAAEKADELQAELDSRTPRTETEST